MYIILKDNPVMYQFIKSFKLIVYFIGRAKFFVALSIIILTQIDAFSQTKLAQVVKLPAYGKTSVKQLLESLQRDKGWLFSYNSQLLNADSVIHANSYNGVLIDYLEGCLGARYSFKETSTHIIISRSDWRMVVEQVDIDLKQHNKTMISGYVKDLRSNKPLSFASVYDKGTYLNATLTNKDGFFELDVKKPENKVIIGLNKENYRDTTLILLLPIEVSKDKKVKKVGYYALVDSNRTIYKTFLGAAFSSTSQRIQSANLGGFFIYSPYQMSLTPGLSTHGFFNSQIVNKVSINVLGGATAGVDGVEFGGVFNLNQYKVRGLQMAGGVNVVGGDVSGLQIAGVGNVVLRNVNGLQMAGGWNKTDTLSGLQLAGIINMAKEIKGGQLAGGVNYVKDTVQYQLAGVMNRGGIIKGVQIAGGINIARETAGNQLAGVINIAKKVKGVQIASLINIADSSDYPIAIFNWIKNGQRQLALTMDESSYLGLNFKSGGRVLYSSLGIGTYLDHASYRYGVEVGLGANLLEKKRFALSAELVQRMHMDKDLDWLDASRSTLRIMPSYVFSKHLRVYIAPSFNYSQAAAVTDQKGKPIWRLWKGEADNNTFHGGLAAGLSYRF